MRVVLSFFFFFLSLPFSSVLLAKTIPPLTGPIVDEVQILSEKEKLDISAALQDLYQKHGIQLQVFITNSLEGEILEEYSIKVVDQWKLGRKGTDKGVLFLIAMNDRQMRIEVGKGLEGDLTDLQSNRIIRKIIPFFKSASYSKGIVYGTGLIIEQILGPQATSLNQSKLVDYGKNSKHGSKIGNTFANLLQVLFWILFVIIFVFGKAMSPGRRGGFYGGGGGRGGSGGGGWSGGGGGFSGGGSSGKW